MPPLIVILGTLGATLGLAQMITTGIDIRDVPLVLPDTIGHGDLPGPTIPLIAVIAPVFLVVFGIVRHKTRFGLDTYAVGSNVESARRVGVVVAASTAFKPDRARAPG